jgi:hypothetical protein
MKKNVPLVTSKGASQIFGMLIKKISPPLMSKITASGNGSKPSSNNGPKIQ